MWRGFAGRGYLSDQPVVRRAAVTPLFTDQQRLAAICLFALAPARSNDACPAGGRTIAHINVSEAGFRKPHAMLSLGVGLSFVVQAKKREVQV